MVRVMMVMVMIVVVVMVLIVVVVTMMVVMRWWWQRLWWWWWFWWCCCDEANNDNNYSHTSQWFPDASIFGIHVACWWQEFNPGGQGSFDTSDFNSCSGFFSVYLGPVAVGGGLVNTIGRLVNGIGGLVDAGLVKMIESCLQTPHVFSIVCICCIICKNKDK